ncbi:MAG: hypothetical protein ACP5O8_02455 [Candidatus Aenigmatarchaeota archaeon]
MEVGKILISMILIFVAILAVYVYIAILSQSQPKTCEEFLSGSKYSILSSLKACVENCWSKHDFGKDVYNDDCYTVRINPSERIEKSEIENFFSIRVKAYFDSLEKDYNYTVKVRYNYTGQEISLVGFE